MRSERADFTIQLVKSVADGMLDVVKREGDKEVTLSSVAQELYGVADALEREFPNA